MPFADGDGRENIQKPIENLRGRLRCALPESLAKTVRAGPGQDATRSRFGGGAYGANGERSAEDAQVMVVDLIAETRIASLIEPYELVEVDGVAVGHKHPVEDNGKPHLAKGFDLARL